MQTPAHELCRDIEFDAGGVRRHQFDRALLFERISGLPVTLAPAAYAPATAELRTMLRTFETDLTPALVRRWDDFEWSVRSFMCMSVTAIRRHLTAGASALSPLPPRSVPGPRHLQPEQRVAECSAKAGQQPTV